MARIGKYKEWIEGDNLILLQGWCRRGLTDAQMAHNIGISVKTFYEWRKTYAPFREALKSGKEIADIEVENALYRRATGWTVEETRQEIDEKGKRRVIKTKKELPGDTTAMIFWLKNRRKEDWRVTQAPLEAKAEEFDDGLIDALKNLDTELLDDDDFLPDEDATESEGN